MVLHTGVVVCNRVDMAAKEAAQHICLTTFLFLFFGTKPLGVEL